jgi:hypothetical protein
VSTRALVLVPPSLPLLQGSSAIGSSYPRTYRDADMRAWADDLATLYRVVEEDRSLPPKDRRLERWLATPRDLLPDANARAVVDVHRQLMGDPASGIKGSLRSDGRIELDGGRHRAHYILERGDTPVPVWVSASDPVRLEQLRHACHSEIDRRRPALLNPDRVADLAADVGRVAVEGVQRTAAPDRYVGKERGENARERAASSPERER